MQYNNKIDIIIPVYNASDKILFRCLSSIACQSIIEDIEVTIVDDASNIETHYQQVVDNFKSIMNINILRYNQNGGPGVARQYGINHTSNEFITFIDVDDTYYGAFAVQALRDGIQMNNGKHSVCIGNFNEIYIKPETQETLLLPHEKDVIWMFGKMYRRNFIEKYKIHFHPTSRANEDNGFNAQVRLYANDNESINFIPAFVYHWHDNPNSITRVNDNEYSFGGEQWHSFYGYVENMIFAIQEVQKNLSNDNPVLKSFVLNCMIRLYEYFLECFTHSNDTAAQNLEYCRWYYKEIYQHYEPFISHDEIAHLYSQIMKGFYSTSNLDNIIPCITLYDFILELKK